MDYRRYTDAIADIRKLIEDCEDEEELRELEDELMTAVQAYSDVKTQDRYQDELTKVKLQLAREKMKGTHIPDGAGIPTTGNASSWEVW